MIQQPQQLNRNYVFAVKDKVQKRCKIKLMADKGMLNIYCEMPDLLNCPSYGILK